MGGGSRPPPGPGRPARIDGFERAAEDFSAAVDALEGDRREAADAELPPPHDAGSLIQLLRAAHACAGVMDLDHLRSGRVVIESVAVSERQAADGEGTDFLNSFHLEDLAAVRAAIRARRPSAALDAYLATDPGVAHRIDVVAHPEAVSQATRVEHLPKGRWPANPAHGLALSQQFAVNRALNELGPGAGLMGVNGPPGTGKTTMLRDILAGNVVERARRLAQLGHPHDAFTAEVHRWTSGDGHGRRIRQLREDLTGFEMVVASANNGAVENVSTEIPSQEAIDEPWRGRTDYFGDIATRVLRGAATGAAGDARSSPPTAWGLVAARLGRKKYRSAFRTAFWFDERGAQGTTSPEAAGRGMLTRLKRWHDGEEAFTTWGAARARYRAAEERVDGLIAERRAAQDRLDRLPEVARRVDAREESIAALRRAVDELADERARHASAERHAGAVPLPVLK